MYHNPLGHFYLGISLNRLGYTDRAIEALKVAIAQHPNFPGAHRLMSNIFLLRKSDIATSKEHRRLAREAARRIKKIHRGELREKALTTGSTTKETMHSLAQDISVETAYPNAPVNVQFISVVSGLPRSGTSMMMQMLEAGGLPLLTDNVRKADEGNPKGYFEMEMTKRLQQDNSWLAKARGKAIKIVSPLLPFLPSGFFYRIIFMERELEEVLLSQDALLEQEGREGSTFPEDRLREIFRKQIAHTKKLLAAHKVPVLYVNYGAALENPASVAERVNEFLGGNLDAASMAKAIRINLYRQRKRQARERSAE